ncbi:MAG: TRAP transporter small permease [Cohaesibacteraceae bacterium]|nr:TRAP transporter small permease [Cohaesibacteraceae bacterium]MBL4876186.1 TRAP transporter small permease [Cohaesibacteraceae bacterium]
MKKHARYSPEGCIASVLFIFLICVVLLQIFGRTGLFEARVWTEELSRWIWVWMALLGLGEAERTNTQLRMDFLVVLAGERIKSVVFTLVDLVYLAVVIQLTWVGYKTVMRTLDNESVTLYFTDAVLYLSYPVASLFVIWRVVQRLLDVIRGIPPYQPDLAGEKETGS